MTNPSAYPVRSLTTRYVVVVTIAMVIGAGIFKSPALVAANAGSETAVYLLWLAGGLISLMGALCYSELAAAFPHAGGIIISSSGPGGGALRSSSPGRGLR